MRSDNIGERLAALEERVEHIVSRVSHLDECVDGVKIQAEQIADLARENRQLWDRRWTIGVTVVVVLIFVSGSGWVSLKEVVGLAAKLIH
jgi:hypothetical protein